MLAAIHRPEEALGWRWGRARLETRNLYFVVRDAISSYAARCQRAPRTGMERTIDGLSKRFEMPPNGIDRLRSETPLVQQAATDPIVRAGRPLAQRPRVTAQKFVKVLRNA